MILYGFEEKYVNPFTDFGFKKIFGEEMNKDLLLDFLNELLREQEGTITDLTYLKNENLGSTGDDRRAIFDLYCINEKGERFIVELQKTKQKFFKDRTIYYSTFPIQEQAKRNDWDFELKAVYMIAILDFVFEEDKDEQDIYRYDVKLHVNKSKKIFYDKLTFIYLEMPKFNKSVDQLETKFEKWLYVLKNLNRLDNIPNRLHEKIFEKVFEIAEIAKFTVEQAYKYEDSLKVYRDLKNSLDSAKDEGREIGLEQGLLKGLEEGKKIGIEEGKKVGIEEGKKVGIEEGKKVGIEEGKKVGIEEGKKVGIEEGKKVGIEEGKIIIALRALKKGFSTTDIIELTGLSEVDIESIKSSI